MQVFGSLPLARGFLRAAMRRYVRPLTLALSVALSASEDARAEGATAREQPVETESYATAMLLSHAIPLASFWTLAVIGNSTENFGYTGPLGINSGVMVLAPPIVHASHGNFGRGAASLGLNLLFVLPGVYALTPPTSAMACLNADGSERNCHPPTFLQAAVIHTALQPIAAMIDMSMATREKPRGVASSGPAVQAGVSPLPGGGIAVGAFGAF